MVLVVANPGTKLKVIDVMSSASSESLLSFYVDCCLTTNNGPYQPLNDENISEMPAEVMEKVQDFVLVKV